MVRAGYDETLAIDPCNLRFVFQGTDPAAETGGDYNKIPLEDRAHHPDELTAGAGSKRASATMYGT